LTKDNIQQVDEILATVQTYLQTTPVDFSSDGEPKPPGMDGDAVQDLDNQVLLLDPVDEIRYTSTGGTSNNNANTHKRAVYKQPLTQEEIEQINCGKLALPVSERNSNFNGEVHGFSRNCSTTGTCEPAVEKWWSEISSNHPQLISFKDFKAKVKICVQCGNSKNCSNILQSMSEFQRIPAKEKDKKTKVYLFEVHKKE